MAQVKPIHKIRAAAYYFVFVSQDLQRITKDFDVNSRTIKRWSKESEWTQVLDDCDYKGDRNFQTQPTRDPEREFDDFGKAREAYFKAFKAGTPLHKLAAVVEEKTAIPRKKVGEWARRHGWREQLTAEK